LAAGVVVAGCEFLQADVDDLLGAGNVDPDEQFLVVGARVDAVDVVKAGALVAEVEEAAVVVGNGVPAGEGVAGGADVDIVAVAGVVDVDAVAVAGVVDVDAVAVVAAGAGGAGAALPRDGFDFEENLVDVVAVADGDGVFPVVVFVEVDAVAADALVFGVGLGADGDGVGFVAGVAEALGEVLGGFAECGFEGFAVVGLPGAAEADDADGFVGVGGAVGDG
jgi:hypothetical protein